MRLFFEKISIFWGFNGLKGIAPQKIHKLVMGGWKLDICPIIHFVYVSIHDFVVLHYLSMLSSLFFCLFSSFDINLYVWSIKTEVFQPKPEWISGIEGPVFLKKIVGRKSHFFELLTDGRTDRQKPEVNSF